MPTTHIVVQGECLSSLAYRYKLAGWLEIYDHPNNAGLKAKRPNPNVLYPGDRVYIPDPRPREDNQPTDRRHIFVVNFPPAYLNTLLLDIAQQPIRNARYELKLGLITLNGSTDGDGWIRAQIPVPAELGTLQVWPDSNDQDTTIQWEVKLGHLDPLETVTGVKGRLNNLGYDCGEINDDVQDERYPAALSQFQQENAVTPDGASAALIGKHLV